MALLLACSEFPHQALMIVTDKYVKCPQLTEIKTAFIVLSPEGGIYRNSIFQAKAILFSYFCRFEAEILLLLFIDFREEYSVNILLKFRKFLSGAHPMGS